MIVELPNDFGGNVISIEVARESAYYRRLMKTCPHHAIRIDPVLAHISCKTCGAELNPIEWIAMMADEWGRVTRLYEQLKLEKAAIDKKSKVKCQKCGAFTPTVRN